ncbi:MAG: BlaI/MecI/CopY family transcriptional regulator [Egibacteraceae bacterium]
MLTKRSTIASMGPREQMIMDILWADRERYLPVREVAERLGEDIAYTTVMTLLTRLHRKGLLRRRQEGKAYTYQPQVSDAEYAAASMSATMERGTDVSEVLMRFVGQLSASEQETLRSILEEQRR